MTRAFKAIIVSLFFAFALATAIAQQSTPKTEKELKLQRQRLQAISMVEQSATEAPLWNDKRAAVLVLADAADLLWDDAPGRAAKWLRKGWDLIDEVSGSPKDEKLKEFFTRSERSDLRTVVLRVARRHDQQLVEKFLKQLSQQQPDDKKERGAFDDRTARSEQLLQLAQQAVGTDPELAFSLAQASLADGLSHGLQSVLTDLRTKSTDLANRLFDLALARFSSGQPDSSEAEVLSGYLFQSGISFSTSASGQTIFAMNPTQQSLPAVAPNEPQRARNFLTAVYQGILTRPLSLETPEDQQRAQRILKLGNRIAGRYETFAPDLAPAVQGFLSQLSSRLSPDSTANSAGTNPGTTGEGSTKRLTRDELYGKRIGELEDAADKDSNPLSKKAAYVKAALATRPEDYERAKGVAEKIEDEGLRADAVSFVLYRAALFLVGKGELEKASELATKITDVSRRAVVKVAIAQRLVTPTTQTGEADDFSLKQQRAFDLLSDVDADLKKEEPAARTAKILLGRTAILVKLDKAQALAALEQAVQVINKLDKFDLKDSAAPDLGLGTSATSGATVARPRIGFDLRSVIELVISTDFEQIAGVVERLTLKEVSGVGRLEVAKLFLQKTKESGGSRNVSSGVVH